MVDNSVIEDWQIKIEALNKEAWAARVSDSARAFSISGEAMELAKKSGYKKGLAEAMRTLGFAHIRLSKNREAKELLDGALKLFKELGDERGQSDIYEYYGIIYRSFGDFDASLAALFTSLDLRLQTHYHEGASLSNYHLGVTYKYIGDFEKALQYLLAGLAIARQHGLWVPESYSLNLIGQVYFETADYEEALVYFQQSLQIRKSSGDKWGEAGGLDNIGSAFFHLGNMEKAIEYCNESLAICRTIGDKKGEANTLFHIGEIWRQKNEESKAHEAALESLAIRRGIDDKKGQAEVLLFLAGVDEATIVNIDASMEYLQAALRIGNEIKSQDLLAKIHFCYYNCYKKNGDFARALESLEIFNTLEKELHKGAVAEKVTNLQISHRAEQAQKEAEAYRLRNNELDLLNQELTRQKEETERQKQLVEQHNRELEIEASLERVRSQAMAMNKPDDLLQICETLFSELQLLGFRELRNTMINIYNEENSSLLNYDHSIDTGTKLNRVPYESHPTVAQFVKRSKEASNVFIADIIAGDLLKDWKLYREEIGELTGKKLQEATALYYYHYSFGTGVVGISNFQPITEEQVKVFERFKNVFNLAYQRYTDIAQAVTQARQAVQQASLDRVRAEIASMRSSEDLQRITPLIWQELKTLHVPFRRCGVFIVDEESDAMHAYLSTPEGKPLGALHLRSNETDLTQKLISHWKKQTIFFDRWNKEQFQSWMNSMKALNQIQDEKSFMGEATLQGLLFLYFLPFTQGMLYVGSTTALSAEEVSLVSSLADAFSIAYARYEDFVQLKGAKNNIEATLLELKATQKQLIQKEKMASLGELTAGIAHEIQNPLNFVNNFSDVNTELLAEVTALIQVGDKEAAVSCLEEIRANEQKICHHGKRADAIVKSMLQHSHSGSGIMESTDINELADEYLRLSYHMFRAKNGSFAARLVTDFYDNPEKVTVAPQDIGRVLLNLFNNAFYSVHEKLRFEKAFEPTVSVTTKKQPDNLVIQIRDNGTGIPKQVLDKIFQPFFTTKPTGEGTGLGLSLSYDIITKGHGGELLVETTEGLGSQFTILLPLQNNDNHQ